MAETPDVARLRALREEHQRSGEFASWCRGCGERYPCDLGLLLDAYEAAVREAQAERDARRSLLADLEQERTAVQSRLLAERERADAAEAKLAELDGYRAAVDDLTEIVRGLEAKLADTPENVERVARALHAKYCEDCTHQTLPKVDLADGRAALAALRGEG